MRPSSTPRPASPSPLLCGESLPLPADLGVEPPAYLNGLGEVVGEMRRRMLDLLGEGDLDTASRTLEAMDAIVELLAGIGYPDGMTRGLRRTNDMARALVERSRADLTTTVVQKRLRRSIGGRSHWPQAVQFADRGV